MTAKIYHRRNAAGPVFIVMSPDGNEFRQFSFLSSAALYCIMEGWEAEVVQ
jgi:putative hemolysin